MKSSAAAAAPPAPMIGKIGRYTVFITPNPNTTQQSSAPPPPVEVPPLQMEKNKSVSSSSYSDSPFGFLWNAVAKLRHAHSSLDEHLADWFGLNQSKYQWALDDFYNNNPQALENANTNEVSINKTRSVV